MRIVIIADYAIAEGGAPQVAIASARALAALGHDVTFIHGVGHAADPDLQSTAGIRTIGMGGRDIWDKGAVRAARDGIWNREHLERLTSILAAFDPGDCVVHVHQWTKYFSPSVFDCIIRLNLPLAVSMHDYFLACPTGLMYRHDRSEPCALEPLSASCLIASCDPRSMAHKAIRIVRTIATRRALNDRPFTVVHVSEIGRHTIGRFLSSAARQHVVENPIEFVDAGPRLLQQGMRTAYCGRLTEDKGAGLVARAASAAGQASLFVGDGPLREEIAAQDPDARVTGWVARSQVRDILAGQARVLVAPSLWPETGPMVVSEAMAMGIPVVASCRAGASGRIVDGRNGFVVEPNEAAISSALARLADDEVAREMGLNAYHDYWADAPTPERHGAKLVEIYAGMIAQRA